MAAFSTDASSPKRSPLLWLLGGCVGGILLSTQWGSVPAILLVSLGLVLTFVSMRQEPRLWSCCFLPAALLIFWGYANVRMSQVPLSQQVPPREVVLDLRVTQRMRSARQHGQVSGFATVTHAPSILSHLEGQRLYFYLMPGEGGATLVRSQHIKAKGVLRVLGPQASPTGFDRFLESQGVALSLSRGRVMEAGAVDNLFYAWCFSLAERFEALLRRGTPEHFASLANPYVAMLLGRKAALTSGQKEAFTQSGTLHLFAISGLHVGIIALSLATLLALLRVPAKPAALIGLACLFLYVQITEASPSAMRAFIMLSFFWGARVFLRQGSAFAALVASALFVLVWDPRMLFNVGFQLSYAVVAGILLYGVPLMQVLWRSLRPWDDLPDSSKTRWQRLVIGGLHGGLGLFCISFAASLMSTPLSIAYFGQCTPGGVLVNMALVSLAGLVMVCGFVSLGFGLLGLGGVSAFLNHAAWVLIYLMERGIAFFNALPGTSWEAGFTHPFWAFGALLGLFLLLIGLASSRRFSAKKRAYLAPPGFLLVVLLLGLNY